MTLVPSQLLQLHYYAYVRLRVIVSFRHLVCRTFGGATRLVTHQSAEANCKKFEAKNSSTKRATHMQSVMPLESYHDLKHRRLRCPSRVVRMMTWPVSSNRVKKSKKIGRPC